MERVFIQTEGSFLSEENAKLAELLDTDPDNQEFDFRPILIDIDDIKQVYTTPEGNATVVFKNSEAWTLKDTFKSFKKKLELSGSKVIV